MAGNVRKARVGVLRQNEAAAAPTMSRRRISATNEGTITGKSKSVMPELYSYCKTKVKEQITKRMSFTVNIDPEPRSIS